MNKDIECVNIIKGLVLDMVSEAKSGHTGGAFSSANFVYILFKEFLNFDFEDPLWIGRDRFVLSAGHESALLYAILYMIGWLTIDDLKQFRSLHSKTPGHPEYGNTPGVECTSGPLGQGAAMSVGMAIASRHMRAKINKKLFDNKIYALLGDGCMQEGVTIEAAAIAGHLKLSNLIWYYDKNDVQISGSVLRSTSCDYVQMFRSMGWRVIHISNAHDHSKIRLSLKKALQNNTSPTLIIGQSIMAYGAYSLEKSAKSHGTPFDEQEYLRTKRKLGLPLDQKFYCPDVVKSLFQESLKLRQSKVQAWKKLYDKLMVDKNFKKIIDQYLKVSKYNIAYDINWQDYADGIATRSALGKIFYKYADKIPNLIGGSADLEESTGIFEFARQVKDFTHKNYTARNIVFGVREFAMAAISNGISLYGGLIPFCSTFLVFSDYARAAIRLSALQNLKVFYIFTHDSFYVGEDGPTHQPVEQVMSLRLIPNLKVIRAADPQELEIMFISVLNENGPAAFCLTRQKIPILRLNDEQKQNIHKGAYVLHEGKNAQYIIFATGSEVHLALKVAQIIGLDLCCVISVPCWELFEAQNSEYKDLILKWHIQKRISIEAGMTQGWQIFTGCDGLNIGINRFGASSSYQELEKEFGFVAEQIVTQIYSKWPKVN